MRSMIVFFDTNVHVALLRGTLDPNRVASMADGPVRMSPVVASELLRGARTPHARRVVNRLIEGMLPIEPPSWRSAWIQAGALLPKIFEDHESIGLARLQNDVLLALTARHIGAAFISYDAHFDQLRRALGFSLVKLAADENT
jgi:predicted nucleic acid-binding protein